MAKVVITGDTETNEVVVTINGKTVEKVYSADVYRRKDYDTGEMKLSVSVSSEWKDDKGVRTFMNVCAAKSPEGKVAKYSGGVQSEFEDFVTNPIAPVDEKNKYETAVASIQNSYKGRK